MGHNHKDASHKSLYDPSVGNSFIKYLLTTYCVPAFSLSKDEESFKNNKLRMELRSDY